MFTSRIAGISAHLATQIFGSNDQNLRELRERHEVDILYRDGEIRVSGETNEVVAATKTLERLRAEAERNGSVTLFQKSFDSNAVPATSFGIQSAIDIVQKGKEVRPKTPGQQLYADAIREHDVVFSMGPAGTGKTYLASAMAVEALKNKQIRKIVLVRPAVEAGESLGFLPGDLYAKINPYLRPLLDAIQEMIDYDQVQELMSRDIIEVAPLAYMRGRTLNDAFIILDEAQNTTTSQMKMFLTRMGTNSKVVVSGDTTQTGFAH